MIDADGSAMFVNLQSFEARLRMQLPGSSIAALGRATIFPLAVSYAQGFYGVEPGVGEPRWGERADVITINNPAKASQMANYSVTLTSGYPSSSEVRVKWPGNAQSRLRVTDRGVAVKRVLTLPPGNSTIEFITEAARVSAPTDPRMLYLHFANPTLTSTAFTEFSKAVAGSVPANQNETP